MSNRLNSKVTRAFTVDNLLHFAIYVLQERDRLAAKKLSKVSQSRERFLLEKGRGRDRARTKEPPTETLASKLRVFIRMQEGQSIEQLTDIIDTIKRV